MTQSKRQGTRRKQTLLVALLASVLVVSFPSPASAHNIDSILRAFYPTFFGSTWDFVSEHEITRCLNGGDPGRCADGFNFNVWAGAQIFLVGDWLAIGGVNKAFARYPGRRHVNAQFTIRCSAEDIGKKFTFRTRAKAGINHLGTWYFSPWAFSGPRTETCTSSASILASPSTANVSEDYGDPAQPSLSAIASNPAIWPDMAPAILETNVISESDSFWSVSLVSGESFGSARFPFRGSESRSNGHGTVDYGDPAQPSLSAIASNPAIWPDMAPAILETNVISESDSFWSVGIASERGP